jgi:hypothetical protein
LSIFGEKLIPEITRFYGVIVRLSFLDFTMIKLMISLLLLSNARVAAEELQWRSELSAGYRSLNYSAGSTELKGDVFSTGAGLTAIYGRFYSSLSAERDIYARSKTPNIDKFNRSDTALSVGYGVGDNISLFVGYKQGVTQLNTTELQAKGLFMGAGAGLPTRYGVFSFSAAYADLGADYRDDKFHAYSGNARGTSLNAAFHGNLTKSLSYGLSLVRHEYYYQHFSTLPFNINENILSIHANLQYHF